MTKRVRTDEARVATTNTTMFGAQVAEQSDALYLTTDFLSKVIDNIPATIGVKEATELRFALVNRAGEELTGVLQEEFLGKNDFDLFPEDQAAQFVARDREVLASGEMQLIAEEEISTRHKGLRTLRTVKLPILNEANKPQYLLVMSEDVTDQKQAEAALAASERRWAFALESAGKGVWEADIANNSVYYSPMWKRMRGFEPDEEVDSSMAAWLQRVHPGDRDRIQETVARQTPGKFREMLLSIASATGTDTTSGSRVSVLLTPGPPMAPLSRQGGRSAVCQACGPAGGRRRPLQNDQRQIRPRARRRSPEADCAVHQSVGAGC